MKIQLKLLSVFLFFIFSHLAWGQENTLTLDVKGSHKYILKNSPEDYYVLLTLKAPSVKPVATLPLNLAIVIDRSGSMADNGKLAYAKEAAITFINQLSPTDRVSLVDYDDIITLLAESVNVGEHRSQLIAKVKSLEPRGSTNLAGGMMKGAEEVERYFKDQQINRVLLLSDGLANEGVTGIGPISALAQGLTKKGIQVTTFGLGADYDEDLMTSIADSSGGHYFFIENPNQIAGIFEKERRALSTVVAKKIKITLEVPSQVAIEEIYGTSYKTLEKTVHLDLPDLYSSSNRKILIKLKPKSSEIAESTLLKVNLSYLNVLDKLNENQLNANVKVDVTNDRDAFEKSADNTVTVEKTRVVSAEEVKKAMGNFSAGDKAGATQSLKRAKNMLEQTYLVLPSPELKKDIENLKAMESGVQNQMPQTAPGKLFIKSNKANSREIQQSQ